MVTEVYSHIIDEDRQRNAELLAKVLSNPEMKALLAFLLKNRLYEFTPIEVSKIIGVTNKTIINRCVKLVNNGLLNPIIVKTRVRSYRVSDFSRINEKKILKK